MTDAGSRGSCDLSRGARGGGRKGPAWPREACPRSARLGGERGLACPRRAVGAAEPRWPGSCVPVAERRGSRGGRPPVRAGGRMRAAPLCHGLKTKAAVKSVIPHYCFLAVRGGLPSRGQRPPSGGSCSGKRLQTRVSWTAGVGSVSSSLFEGALRGKYGKSRRVHAGRLIQVVWPGLGGRGQPAAGPGHGLQLPNAWRTASHPPGPFCPGGL